MLSLLGRGQEVDSEEGKIDGRREFKTQEIIIHQRHNHLQRIIQGGGFFGGFSLQQVQLNGDNFPRQYNGKDSFSELTRGCIKVHTIQPGKLSCILSVKPAILNAYRSMYGGAVGAVAERVSIACARTVVGKDKELFLGELGMSYISAAPNNVELVVDGSVIRSGRNITTVAVDFRLKDSGEIGLHL